MYSKKSDIKGKVKEVLDTARDFNFKERFGEIPKSVMNFKKSKELMELIEYDSSDIGKIEGDANAKGGGYAQNLRYSIYNPDMCKFIIDYYTKEGDLVLDPFMGRCTRPLVSLHMNRKYVGFDINKKTYELNFSLLDKKFPGKSDAWCLWNSSGTDLSVYSNNVDMFDAILTCPPYYYIEKYGGEESDLSYMSIEQFNNEIQKMFNNIYRLIKPSSYSKMEFHPVIITVGSLRLGEKGLIDMDYEFQRMAKKSGFVLHDKLYTVNNSPGAGFTFRRNYCYKFLTKNYETTLIFLKYTEKNNV